VEEGRLRSPLFLVLQPPPGAPIGQGFPRTIPPVSNHHEDDAILASALAEFLERWRRATGNERSNSQLFLTELCVALGLIYGGKEWGHQGLQ